MSGSTMNRVWAWVAGATAGVALGIILFIVAMVVWLLVAVEKQ